MAEEAKDDRFTDGQACAQVLVVGPGAPIVAGDLLEVEASAEIGASR